MTIAQPWLTPFLELGIRLWLEEDQLKSEPPATMLSESIRQLLHERRADLMAALRAQVGDERERRLDLLERARFNVGSLSSADVPLDLHSDSWSDQEKTWVDERTQELTRRIGQPCDLDQAVQRLFRLPHYVLMGTGLASMAAVCSAFKAVRPQSERGIVIHTGLSANWHFQLLDLDYELVSLVSARPNPLFAGDPDLELLAAVPPQHLARVNFVLVELLGAKHGSAAVSLEGLQRLRAHLPGVPLVLDATHVLDNARLVAAGESAQRGRDPLELAAAFCDLADVVVVSLSRGYALPSGGLVAARDHGLIQKMALESASSGRMSSVHRRMVAHALADLTWLQDQLQARTEALMTLHAHLAQAGLTSMLTDRALLLESARPGPQETVQAALLAELYLTTGLRGLPLLDWERNGKVEIALVMPLGFDHKRALQVGQCLALCHRQSPQLTLTKDGVDIDAQGLPRACFRLTSPREALLAVLREASSLPAPLAWPTAAPSAPEAAISTAEALPVFPLSEGQKALYFIHHLAPDNNMSGAFRLPEDADVDLIMAAFADLQQRHPMLRTTFFHDGTRPMQRVHGQLPVPLVRHRVAAEPQALFEKVFELTHLIMDPEQGPLAQIHLIEGSSEGRYLVVLFHHLVNDGASQPTMLEDWTYFCKRRLGLELPPLPPLPQNGYAEFVAWQEALLSSDEGQAHLAFWRARLEPPPPALPLATDLPRPARMGFRGAICELKLEPELVEALKQACSDQHVSLFMFALAAWQILLGRASRTTDVCIGSLNGSRPAHVSSHEVGFFTNVLPLRANLAGNPSLHAFFDQIREVVFDAIEHADYPFNHLAQTLGNPHLYQAGIVFQSWMTAQEGSPENPFGLHLSQIHLASFLSTSQTDLGELALELAEVESGLRIFLKYNIEVFTHSRVAGLAKRLEHLMRQMIAHPRRGIDDLELMDEAERVQVLQRFNDTGCVYDLRPSYQLLEAWAKRQPGAAAVYDHLDPLAHWDYAQFEARVAGLASHLQTLGVGPDQLVGVSLERSPTLVVALFAIQAAGGAYVPLDPSLPAERLAYMVEDAAVNLILTREDGPFSAKGQTTLHVNNDLIERLIGRRPRLWPYHPERAAYMIYTSGSTGRPKGAINAHGAILNRLAWHQQSFALRPGERVMQKTPFSFDVSVWEFFWPFHCGGALVVAAPEVHRDPAALVALTAASHTHVMHFVPSMFQAFLEEPGLERITALRAVICSGEALSLNLQRLCFARLPGVALHNLYGPTEAAVDVSWWPCQPGDQAGFVPIGAPIANTSLYVVDQRLRPLGLDLPGELCLGGVQLARGYHRRPALTAEKFVPDPFSATPGARLYRTGDLAAWMASGNVRFLGRIDFQIKLRGLRIELGELEAAINAVPGVSETVVLARKDPRGELCLVAYAQSPLPAEALAQVIRESLARQLPAYMVPAFIVVVERFPTSPNGKVERRLLPEPAWQTEKRRRTAPHTELELRLARIWAEVLERPDAAEATDLGLEDAFLELGGHSLSATRVVARIRREFDCELSLQEFFQHPTLGDLARLLAQRTGATGAVPLAPAPAWPRLPRAGSGPLSAAQQRLLFIEKLEPGLVAYILSGAALLRGHLDTARLQRAFELIGLRHETLRSAFREVGDADEQFFLASAPPPLVRVDHTQLPESERMPALHALARARAATPFDLGQPPLWRLALVRWSEDQHVLLLDIHHLIADFWSINVLLNEFSACYAALGEDRAPSLAELPAQYVDYAAWQQAPAQRQRVAEQLAYWRRALEDVPAVLNLPLDFARPARPSYRGALLPLAVPQPIHQSLRAFCRRLEITPYVALLAALQRLLHCLSGERDIVVGMPLANREQAEIQDLIGFFVNTLVQRSIFDATCEAAGFEQFAAQVGQRVREALSHQDVPFEQLVDALDLPRDQSHNPLYQVVFQLLELPGERQLGGLGVRLLDLDYGIARFDLALHLFADGDRLHGFFEYSTDLFRPTTVARFTELFLHLLEQLLAEPRRPLAAIETVPESQRRELLAWMGDPTPPREELFQIFLRQVAERPLAPALVCGQSLDYAGLRHRANRLAQKLEQHGVRRGAFVAVCCDRGPLAVVALLAILEVGAAYLPIDTGYPPERIAAMLDDSGAGLILATDEADLSDHVGQVLRLDQLELDQPAPLRVFPTPPEQSAAYLMYTSGSTGRPKGVVVPRAAIVRLVRQTRYCDFNADRVFILAASLAFDAATFEIWGALLNGASLAILPGRSIEPLAGLLRQHRVDTLWLTAQLFHMIMDEEPDSLAGCRQLLAGGEALSPRHVRAFLERFPANRLINGYGPTENTTFTCCADLNATGLLPGGAPLGPPISGTTVFVVDPALRLCPIGVYGELVTGGAGLAWGYHRRPALTAEKFVPNPFSDQPGARLYRTGDLTRWQQRGDQAVVEFAGRIDRQVKLRGFRIELGEIEANLLAVPGIVQALVVAIDRTSLVAYLVTDRAGLEPTQVRTALSRQLPDYMVPAHILFLPAFPVNANGKVDRRLLPLPQASELLQASRPPADAVEEILVGIWAELLSLPQAAVDTEFFSAGGNSLLAARAVARVRRHLGQDLPLRVLFEQPTPEALARWLRDRRSTIDPRPALVASTELRAPLSYTQTRLWFVDQLEPGSGAYNIPLALHLSGPLCTATMKRVLERLIARHESLRTRFVLEGEEPRQQVDPEGRPQLGFVDLSRLPATAQASTATKLLAREAARPFDLAQGHLLRCLLVRHNPDLHLFVFNFHHIIGDGRTLEILLDELRLLYASLAWGQEPSLPPLAVQYRDFARWQRAWPLDWLDQRLKFWVEKLAGAPQLLSLPADFSRPQRAAHAGQVQRFQLPPQLMPLLDRHCLRTGATRYMTLLGIYGALIARYASQPEVCIGTPVANRTLESLERVVGFFANTLTLRMGLVDDPNLDQLSAHARQIVLEALEHQDMPFDLLVEHLAPKRLPGVHPLFQTSFSLETVAPGLGQAGLRMGPLQAVLVEAEVQSAKFDCSMLLFQESDQLHGRMEYSVELFRPSAIAALVQTFTHLVEQWLERPETPLSRLSWLDPSTRAMVLEAWNPSPRPYPRDASLQSLIATYVERQPDTVALLFEQETRTWRQWWDGSASLAQVLRQRGVRPGEFVAVSLPRSLELVEAILAVAQIGAVYQPIDANQPRDRQRFMLEETGARLLVTYGDAPARDLGPELVLVDEPRPEAPGFRHYPGCGDDLAYIIYTSGSTGRPKGVAATHRGVVRLVYKVEYLDLSRGERTLFASTIGFDASVLDMWSSLLNGGSLAILPERALDRVGNYLSAYQVTTCFLTTQLFHVLVDEHIEAFASMRQLISGGEAMSPAHARRFLEAYPGVVFYNAYGPTENGVLTSTINLNRYPMLPSGVPLGLAIDHTTLYVVDHRLQLQPLGAYGELVTGGDGLAHGYYRRAALTAEKFVPNPFSDVPGSRLYRTGDLVRWIQLEQGPVFEFAGRIDRQVKLRGFRIEIGEIENALSSLPGVAQALVLLSNAHGDARLIAYAVPHPGFHLEPAPLLRALAERLPAYMVPAALVPLAQFPVNANGKIDRTRLPEPAPESATHEVALTPGQAWLRDLWRELLDIESIGPDDNFFNLGGHSLLATRLVARIRARLGVAFSLQEVFANGELAAMAEALERARAAGTTEEQPLFAESVCELSFSQQRLWFIDQLQPGDPTYHIPLRLRWRGPLDSARLERALELIVERHESLRTSFPSFAEGPRQRIEAPITPRASLHDLSDLAEADREAVLAELARRSALAPFNLEQAPLFRWELVRVGQADHWLLLTLHHIIADGWSLQILLREWVEAYDALALGSAPTWRPLPLRYRDYALRQRAELVGAALQERETFWRDYLAGELPPLELPTDSPRPKHQDSAGALLTLPFPPALEQALAEFRRGTGATTYQTLLAVLVALLRRHSGQGEFLVASPVANRPRAELEGIIGFFVNTLVLRLAVEGGETFTELVTRAIAASQAAFAHQDYPFERLVAMLQPNRDLGRAPLAQIMFQVLEHDSFEVAGPSRLELWDPLENPAQLDLSFAVRGDGQHHALYLTYATALFRPESARRLAGHFLHLATALLAAPQAPVDRVAFIDAAERTYLLHELNRTDDAFDRSATIHGLIQAQAHRQPSALAVTHGLTHLDYATLLARAQANAARLRAHGVVREQPVGVCLHRNEDLIVALLAVLLAGGAYVPIDPAYPEDRKRHMLDDSGARVILTDTRERANLPETLERLTVTHERLEALDDARCLPEQLAYIIYTSGSTGRPKGVAIQHLNACALFHWSLRYFSDAEMAVVLASTSICFDLSVYEIFATLARGCRIVVVENVLYLADAPAANQVTLINTVPSAMTELLHLGVPSSVTTVNLAGEPFQASLIHAIYALPHVKAVHNLYGPSEDTTYSTGTLLPRDLSGIASIGGPILNTQLYLLDRHAAPVPFGVAGEVQLGGLGITRGYFRRPALTAEKFVPDPFASSPGSRLYRTGDLARYRVDGALLFLGRIDHQVKIRGFRIELGEIEARIAQRPEVEKTLVTTHQDERGVKRLVAYVQPRRELDPPSEQSLRAHLDAQLPEYMVPAAFIVLEFPLTPNGKVDRKRLPAPVFAAAVESAPSESLSPTASALALIWSEILGQSVTRGSDNFFQLGGHSLLATRVVTRVRQQLGLELHLRTMFEYPSLAALASQLEQSVAAVPSPAATISAYSEDFPQLSFAQSRLWFIDQLEPGNPAYNLPLSLVLEGPLHTKALQDALARLAARHESLRTCFAQGEAGPYQQIAPHYTPELRQIDLRVLGARAQQQALKLLAQEALLPFDLTYGPLWRAYLLRVADQQQFLALTLHHTIGDGWSLTVLLGEVFDHYRDLVQGVAVEPPPLPMQYRDYVRWQYQLLASGELERQLDFWRAHHAGELPVLELPTDRPRPRQQDFSGDQVQLTLSSRARVGIMAFARERSVTPYLALLSVLAALLHRYSGQVEFTIGTPVANRDRMELEPMIGFFVNTLVPRIRLSGALSFEQLLSQVGSSVLACFGHRDLPFERLVEALQPERDLSRNPLFQIMFQYMAIEDPTKLVSGVSVKPQDLPVKSCHFDLSLSATERNHQLTLYLAFATSLFERETMERFLKHFVALAEALTAAPDQPIATVSFLRADERLLLLTLFNQTDSPYPRASDIGRAFGARLASHPDRTALLCGQTRWSYRQLAERAQGYALVLRDFGIAREQTVGVCMTRQADLVAALLGTVLAGAVYVPVDPTYPDDRKQYMLEDSGARWCIVDDITALTMPRHLELIFPEDLEAHRGSWAPLELEPQQLAYLIYTSGSTGRPKGVAIHHGNALALFHWASHYFRAEDWDGVLGSTSVCFDLSVFEIFATLANGGKLVLVENLLYLAESPHAAEVRMINTVPSAMTELLNLGAVPPSVTTVNLAGEPFQAGLIHRIYALPHVRVVNNLYGPSEDTTYSTGCALPRDLAGIAPIGGPILNTRLYLVDREGRLCARGLAGEILLGGDGLSRGYFRRPGLTAARYVPNPFAGSGERLYRTGDLGRWRNDGSLVYLGRIDHQVKLRGFRIELGEIEAEIAKCEGVGKCLVMAPADDNGTRRLIAFVQSEQAADQLEREIREHLDQRLPEYMVPSVIVVRAQWPLTPNGKVDRKALLALPLHKTQAESAATAPRDAIEAQLLAIWREVLGLERIGIQDNFFKLGGHSLLAVRVLAQIAQKLGVRLPLASFFQATSISQLAELLRRQEGSEYRPLHCLRAEGSRPPLYLVHAVGGGLLGYRGLVQALADRPIYGFVAQGFEDENPPLTRLNEMVNRYVEALLAHQPQGPHLLGGWSMGGVLASAMVARLRELGQPTLPPVLFDAHAPLPAFKQDHDGSERGVMCYFLIDLAGQAGTSLEIDPALLEALRHESTIRVGYHWAKARGLLGDDLSESDFARLFAVFRANFGALLNYEPVRLEAVLLFRAQAGPEDKGRTLGWDQLCERVDAHAVAGDHFTMLTPAVLSSWIEILEDRLGQPQTQTIARENSL